MQKQSNVSLPVVYDEPSTSWGPMGGIALEPTMLSMIDVTFLHYHAHMEIGYCVAGEGVCHVDTASFPFKPGDVQVIFPNQRHIHQTIGPQPSVWHWVYIAPVDLLNQCGFTDVHRIDQIIYGEMALCGILDGERYATVAQLVRKMVHLDSADPCSDLLFASLLLQMLLELRRCSQGLPRLTLTRDNLLPSIEKALEQIKVDLEEGTRTPVRVLARMCDMSETNFRRVFRKKMGVAPLEYIQACSMYKARRLLLATDAKISEIASATGFSEIVNFNRCFLAYNGVSPSAFRKQYRPP